MSPTYKSFFEKHRPKLFSEMAGNHSPIQMLRGMFHVGEFHNGFSLHGDNGTGKSTAARCLCRSLLCENRPERQLDACGHCDSCINWRNDDFFFGKGVRVRNCTQLTLDDVKTDFDELGLCHELLIFFYDEFQRCRHALQDLLVTKLEEEGRFVLIISTPDPAQIKEKALRQRLIPLQFTAPTNKEMTDYLLRICSAEGVLEVERDFIAHLCQQQSNNPRECLNALRQILYQSNCLTFSEFNSLYSCRIKEQELQAVPTD